MMLLSSVVIVNGCFQCVIYWICRENKLALIGIENVDTLWQYMLTPIELEIGNKTHMTGNEGV